METTRREIMTNLLSAMRIGMSEYYQAHRQEIVEENSEHIHWIPYWSSKLGYKAISKSSQLTDPNQNYTAKIDDVVKIYQVIGDEFPEEAELISRFYTLALTNKEKPFTED